MNSYNKPFISSGVNTTFDGGGAEGGWYQHVNEHLGGGLGRVPVQGVLENLDIY